MLVKSEFSNLYGMSIFRLNRVIWMAARSTPLDLPLWGICLWGAGSSSEQWSRLRLQSGDDCQCNAYRVPVCRMVQYRGRYQTSAIIHSLYWVRLATDISQWSCCRRGRAWARDDVPHSSLAAASCSLCSRCRVDIVQPTYRLLQ